MTVDPRRSYLTPVAAAEKAVAAIGCGYDLCCDSSFSYVKPGLDGSRLIELDQTLVQDLVLPGGVVVPNVPKAIKCDRGGRMRYRSDVLSFNQMAEQFNQVLSSPGKIPSGLFNSMFGFRGCWQKDASTTKSLAFDGWYITLYSVELVSSHIVLLDRIKQEVPSSWDPAALAEFIQKYGTHIIVGLSVGGKDVIYLKQQKDSLLQESEVQSLLKKLVDERFSETSKGDNILVNDESSRKMKVNNFEKHYMQTSVSVQSTMVSQTKNGDITSNFVRRGGIDKGQSHNQWLVTIPQAPNLVTLFLVPITSLLNGVKGSGFLSHAVNLYCRYKPPIEELCYFLEFQIPRQWAPAFGELPLGPQRKKQSLQWLQFTLMGPRLYVNNIQVDSQKCPVTGIRLYLEGKRNDRLAIHLQHLSTQPNTINLSDATVCAGDDSSSNQRAYFEPVKWALFSHICTAPVQYNVTSFGDSAHIVTKAWLEVKEFGMRKVLFLRLAFSNVPSMKIRRSEWDAPTTISQKSGSISALISSRFSTGLIPEPKGKVEVNSAIYPKGPPMPIRMPRMARYVDITEVSRGPDDLPGYWVVTGAKLCVEGGKIFLQVKYSLLIEMLEDDFLS
ncbi:MACPF domain-containing protein NSL1-like isoform X1 [Zingiber officinale]|uniref:MACPF domain-containing protein n=2 Tax=Zingiber officinale TaxID=94328 RepID=A0A8J5GVM4_ZINOF|nr:MACPF domain-containing protein NSL1-like isoform X1 [Zingiber officinale]KAG6514885.1 hypothetical protein ZIOFF_025260 [Zingiber officinale]